MKIKDRPDFTTKPKPVTFPPETTVREAIDEMTKRNFGSVIVVNPDDTIAGIVTERDLLKKLLYNRMDPDSTKLSEIMTKEVRVAKEDDYMQDWLRIMSNERFRHLPIVNDNGQVVNMVSQGDFVSYTWPELIKQVKETAKASLGPGFQVILIVIALLAYAFLISMFN